MTYLIRSPELNIAILAREDQPITWFVDMVTAKGGTLTWEAV